MIDEWKNFLARIGRDENEVDPESFDNSNDILALRFWASYRGQTLARTGKFYAIFKILLVHQLFIYLPEILNTWVLMKYRYHFKVHSSFYMWFAHNLSILFDYMSKIHFFLNS